MPAFMCFVFNQINCEAVRLAFAPALFTFYVFNVNFLLVFILERITFCQAVIKNASMVCRLNIAAPICCFLSSAGIFFPAARQLKISDNCR